jgi:hypothetical protein
VFVESTYTTAITPELTENLWESWQKFIM